MSMSEENVGRNSTNDPIMDQSANQLEKERIEQSHNVDRGGNHLEKNKLDTASTNQPKESNGANVFKIPEKFTKNGRKKAVSFPLKLMHILSHKEYEDVITWLPDGKSFKITDRDAFTAFVLPKYFKEAKYSSFTRKLLRWGFQYHKTHYIHRLFQKDRLDLIDSMTCQSNNEKAFNFPGNNAQFLQPNPMMIASHGYQMMNPQQMQTNSFQVMSSSGAPPHPSTPSGLPSVNQNSSADKMSALKAIDDELIAVRSLLQKKKMEAASLHSGSAALSMQVSKSIHSSGGAGPGIQLHAKQALAAPPGSVALPPTQGSSVPTSDEAQGPLTGATSQQSTVTSHYNDPGKIDPVSIEMEIRRRVQERMEASGLGAKKNLYH